MAQSIIIGEGSDQITLSGPNLQYELDIVQIRNERGIVDAVEYTVSVETDVVGASSTAVFDSTVDLSEEVTTKFTNRRVQVRLDSVTKFDLEPGSGFVGPYVRRFRTFRDDGTGESHWRCAFEIFYRAIGASTSYDLSTTISIEKTNGKIIRKTWTASCKAASSANALNVIMGFKPAETNLREKITRSFQEAKADAVWIWEPRRENINETEIECRVQSLGGGVDYVVQKQVGLSGTTGKYPNAFLARKDAIIIQISGHSIGYTNQLTPPPAHYSESATMKRLTAREPSSTPRVHSVEKGQYILEWSEVWMAIGDTGAINHNGHDVITLKAPPADGSMVT